MIEILSAVDVCSGKNLIDDKIVINDSNKDYLLSIKRELSTKHNVNERYIMFTIREKADV